jgi:hypothetical protein
VSEYQKQVKSQLFLPTITKKQVKFRLFLPIIKEAGKI